MEQHLQKQYGFKNFRSSQKDVIQDILNGDDTIVVFPTGAGKSICYQFPATYLDKISVVISPLISLMADQNMKLTASGIKSMCLNSETYTKSSSLLSTRKDPIIDEIKKVSVVYCTPEFFVANVNIFKQIIDNIVVIAVDESHCISQWGADFRKSYRSLSIIKKEFPSIAVAAFTATATPAVLKDIFDVLEFDEVNQYSLGTKRENLSIFIRQKGNDIFRDLDINPEESTIIYTQTRKEAEKIHKLLRSYNIPCGCYHAGMTAKDKTKAHNDFITDKVKTLVATICFGMGIDKPDIRKIINYGSPCSLETYYQEIGRAGRDGLPSNVILFYNDSDFATSMFLISKSPNREHKHKILNIFRKYINNHNICRQLLIEHYFENGTLSNNISNKDKCGKCDNCSDKKSETNTLDIIDDSRLIVSLVDSLTVNYGMIKLINVLRGSKSSTIKNLFNNPFYTKGSHLSIDDWKRIIDVLVTRGYLERKLFDRYTVIGLGEYLLEETLPAYLPTNKQKIDPGLEKLRMTRNKLAVIHNIAPYMIANDQIIDKMSKVKPKTIQDLLDIDGINYDFVCNYGKYFLDTQVTDIKIKTNEQKSHTNNITYELYKNGNSIEEITNIRGLKKMTIEKHIINFWTENINDIDIKRIGLTLHVKKEISDAIEKVGKVRLKPIKELVNKNISYFQIQVCLLII